jgi:hypothetical protein
VAIKVDGIDTLLSDNRLKASAMTTKTRTEDPIQFIIDNLSEADRHEFIEGFQKRVRELPNLPMSGQIIDSWIADWYATAVVTSSPDWRAQMDAETTTKFVECTPESLFV